MQYSSRKPIEFYSGIFFWATPLGSPQGVQQYTELWYLGRVIQFTGQGMGFTASTWIKGYKKDFIESYIGLEKGLIYLQRRHCLFCMVYVRNECFSYIKTSIDNIFRREFFSVRTPHCMFLHMSIKLSSHGLYR